MPRRSAVVSYFTLILALATVATVDSFVGYWAAISSLKLPSGQPKELSNSHSAVFAEKGRMESSDQLDVGMRSAAKRFDWKYGRERRDVLATVGLIMGWNSNIRMILNGSSRAMAATLDDAEATSDSSDSAPSLSPFPQLGSADNGARSRTIEITWDASDQGSYNIDSFNSKGTSAGSKVRLSYQLPERWKTSDSDPENNYIDVEKQAKACNHITVYQAPAPVGEYASMEALEKATGRVGVAKALHTPDWLSDSIQSADLLSARKENKQHQQQTLLELEMASAPRSCNTATNNNDDKLGLGIFCPYDTIYLVSATIFDGRLYVLVVDASSEQWKRSNGDLKFIRSSFSVQTL